MADALITMSKSQYDFNFKLGNFVQYLQMGLPSSNGNPLQLLDPSIIAESIVSAETPDDLSDAVLQLAARPIEIIDGFPCVDGVPVWERLDGELLPYYQVFKAYRDMKKDVGCRSLTRLASEVGLTGRQLNALNKAYHWAFRCRAFDKYVEDMRRLQRQRRIEALEERHSTVAEQMLEDAMGYLSAHQEQLNPKIALQMVQTAVKVGRLAVGLSGDGNGKNIATTNVNVQATTNTTGDHTVNQQNVLVGESAADFDQLQSILHVLDQSGALQTASVIPGDVVDADVIDADIVEE